MARIVLGLIGEMAAGKTTATAYLEAHYHAETFRFSTSLRDILTRLHKEHTRDNLQQLSTVLRGLFGDDVLSKVIAQDVAKADAEFIVVEGIRRPGDIAYLRDLPNFYLVGLQTEEKIRFERLRSRSENPDDAGKSWEDFQKESHQESEEKIRELIQKADYIIENDSSFADTYQKIDAVVREIKAVAT